LHPLKTGSSCRTRSRRQTQRPLNQLSPPFVGSALDEHAIEAECCGNQPLHAMRDAVLGGLNAAGVFLREQFHDRPLRPHEIRGAVLEPTERE
jgi:hypothetical protein